MAKLQPPGPRRCPSFGRRLEEGAHLLDPVPGAPAFGPAVAVEGRHDCRGGRRRSAFHAASLGAASRCVPWELLLGLTIGGSSLHLHAGAPSLDHFYPVAVQVGSTNSVTVIGKFDPWPPRVWVDANGIVFNAETNSGKFTVEIATNAPVGPHLVRVFNEQGPSGPRFLIVPREPQSSEQEPNDDFRKPQTLEALPVSL